VFRGAESDRHIFERPGVEQQFLTADDRQFNGFPVAQRQLNLFGGSERDGHVIG
jgi:hypothetical protein